MPDRLAEYVAYHQGMLTMGDLDPAYPMLRYLCDRFELNVEQRYWLAFLYAVTYCGPTVFYAYNEFPDWENVDPGRLERWWHANRERLLFQTDRRWVRSRNQFCAVVASYTDWVRKHASTQELRFRQLAGATREETYDRVFREAGRIFQFGRYALFLYTEAVHVVTGLPMEPTGLDLANAESSRNGLCYALGRDDLITGKETGRTSLPPGAIQDLQSAFGVVLARVRAEDPPGLRSTVWNVETSLCAYKKLKRGQRYLGYYLDRQAQEIQQMKANVREGVDWSVLWDFRRETFQNRWLAEARLPGYSPPSPSQVNRQPAKAR